MINNHAIEKQRIFLFNASALLNIVIVIVVPEWNEIRTRFKALAIERFLYKIAQVLCHSRC